MGRARTSRGRSARTVPLQTDYESVAAEQGTEEDRGAQKEIPFLDGDTRFLAEQTITASSSAVYRHDLGRVIRGWLVSRIRGTAVLDGGIRETAADEDTITIMNDSTVDVDLSIVVF